MTERPYEVLARFGADGKVAGVSCRHIETVNGRDYEGDPQPLSGTDDPEFAVFAEAFSAAVVAERDSLQADKTTLTTELATATATIATREATITQHETTIAARDATIETMHADATAAATAAQESAATAAATIADLTTEKQTLTQQVATLTSEKAAVQAELDALKETLIPTPTRIWPREFLQRFTTEEIVSIQLSTDPGVILARTHLQTAVGLIDMTLPETQQLVGLLVLAGIINSSRAAEVLT